MYRKVVRKMDKDKLLEVVNESVNRNVLSVTDDLLSYNNELYALFEQVGVQLTDPQKEIINNFSINTVKHSTAASALVTMELIEKFIR